MKYVIFELAGTHSEASQVFLQSRHRKYKQNTAIMHNNSKHTVLRIPAQFFKDNFKYDAKTGTYKNKLKWQELIGNGFVTVFDLMQ